MTICSDAVECAGYKFIFQLLLLQFYCDEVKAFFLSFQFSSFRRNDLLIDLIWVLKVFNRINWGKFPI